MVFSNKRVRHALICLISSVLLLCFIGCATTPQSESDANDISGAEAQDSASQTEDVTPKKGILRLTLPSLLSESAFTGSSGGNASTVFPLTGYIVSLSGPDGETLVAEIIEESYENELDSGIWNYLVQARDTLGELIYQGSGSINVVGGTQVGHVVELEPIELDRTFALIVTWPPNLLESATAELIVRRQAEGRLVGGEPVDIKIIDAARAMYAADLTPGQYVIQVEIFEDSVERTSFLESIQITNQDLTVLAKSLTVADFNMPPKPVESIKAAPRSDEALDVSWTDVSDNEDGFTLLRKSDSGGQWETVAELEPNTTMFHDAGLIASTRYQYRVDAYNQYGVSPSQTTVQETLNWDTMSDFLLEPVDEAVIIDTYPQFAWQDVEGAVGYELQVSTSADFPANTISTRVADETSHRISQMLGDQTTYFWRVRGYNEDSIPGYWSPSSTFSVQLEVAIEITTDADVANTGESNRFLQGQPFSATVQLPGVSLDDVTYMWLLNGEPYAEQVDEVHVRDHLSPGTYTLSCIVTANDSVVAGSVRFTVLSELAVGRFIPADKETLWYTDRKVISWDAVPTAKTYHIQIVDPAIGYHEYLVDIEDLVEPEFELLEEIESGKTYAYRIRAADLAGGWSSWTPYLHFATGAIRSPEILFPVDHGVVPDPRPEIRWENLAGIGAYEVRVSRLDGSNEMVATVDEPHFLPERDLGRGVWKVQVRAKTVAAELSGWATRNFTIAGIPTTTLVEPVDGTRVFTRVPLFTWTPIEGISQYEFVFVAEDAKYSGVADDMGDAEESVVGESSIVEEDPIATFLEEAYAFEQQMGSARLPVELQTAMASDREEAEEFLESVVVTGSEYTPKNDLAYGTHYWKVRAQTQSGATGRFSETRKVEIIDPVPRISEDIIHRKTTDPLPVLTWKPVSGATTYEVQVARIADEYPEPVECQTTEFMPAEPLSPGVWKWRVRTKPGEDTLSEYSASATLEISVAPPMAMSPVADFRTSNRRPALKWEYKGGSGEGTEAFEVQIAPGEVEFSEDTTFVTTEQTYAPSEMLEPGVYRWRVRAKSDDGIVSDYSDTLTFEVTSTIVPLVEITGGSFEMGSDIGDKDEVPVRTVTVSSFMIGAYEITQALYEQIMGENPSVFSDNPDGPVDNVTWLEAVRFCNALSEVEGRDSCYTIDGSTVTCDPTLDGFRLPTESEWEFAARYALDVDGVAGTEGAEYAGSDDPGEVAWYSENSEGSPHSVGALSPNGAGLFDMSGNVWEWIGDTYGSYGSVEPYTGSRGTGEYKVLRGGSWDSVVRSLRVTNRSIKALATSDERTGFRVVATITSE